MVTVTADISSSTLESLQKLAKENHRKLSQEISYRLDQAIHYNTHINDDQVGLFQVISKLYEIDDSDEDASFLESIKRAERSLN